MAKCLEFARQVVRRGASLDADQAWWQLRKERQHVETLQLAADDHLTRGIHSVDLKDRLGDVETDCRYPWLAPLNRGSLNSAHIHGTHVPVEEPSTASFPDSCIAAKQTLFDHFVRAGEHRCRQIEAERLGGFQPPARTWSASAPADQPASL